MLEKKTWLGWIYRRIAESITFCLVALIASKIIAAANIEAAFQTVVISLFAYAIALMYLPLSAFLWSVSTKMPRTNSAYIADTLFFFVHGYVAMSIMHNGLWIVSRPIDWSNELVLGWIGVAVLHILFIGRVFPHGSTAR